MAGTTIYIKKETKARLKALGERHANFNESYDQLLNKLIDKILSVELKESLEPRQSERISE